MTEYANSREFFILKISILGFGLFTLPGIILMLYQYNFSLLVESMSEYRFLSTLQLVCFFIGLIGFVLFALGLRSFASSYTNKIGKEGKRISLYLILVVICIIFLSIFGFIFSFMIGDLHMKTSLIDIADSYSSNSTYKNVGRFWGIGILLIFLIYLILTIRISVWLNKVKLPFSERKTLLLIVPSVLYLLAALFTFISTSMLFPPINAYFIHPLERINDVENIMMIIPLEDIVEAQFLSYFFLLFGFLSQLIVSVNLSLNLHRLASLERNFKSSVSS